MSKIFFKARCGHCGHLITEVDEVVMWDGEALHRECYEHLKLKSLDFVNNDSNEKIK